MGPRWPCGWQGRAQKEASQPPARNRAVGSETDVRGWEEGAGVGAKALRGQQALQPKGHTDDQGCRPAFSEETGAGRPPDGH